jgi:hypothetical protein
MKMPEPDNGEIEEFEELLWLLTQLSPHSVGQLVDELGSIIPPDDIDTSQEQPRPNTC